MYGLLLLMGGKLLKIIIYNYFDAAFLINLKNRKDRLDRVYENLEKVDLYNLFSVFLIISFNKTIKFEIKILRICKLIYNIIFCFIFYI